MNWYGARCIFRYSALPGYEERLTLWQAPSFDEALAMAEAEAREYAEVLTAVEYLGLVQLYALSDEDVTSGSEVFSLVRDSELPPPEYLDAYFDTGSERQLHWTASSSSSRTEYHGAFAPAKGAKGRRSWTAWLRDFMQRYLKTRDDS